MRTCKSRFRKGSIVYWENNGLLYLLTIGLYNVLEYTKENKTCYLSIIRTVQAEMSGYCILYSYMHMTELVKIKLVTTASDFNINNIINFLL